MDVSSRAEAHASHLREVVADDATLVAQVLRGDERAFGALYRRHASYIAGVAYRLMGGDAELDDVVQETFVDASRAMAQLEDPAGVRGWLVRIAVRRVHKRFAKRRRFRWLLGEAAHVAPTTSDPRAAGELDALYQALERLAPDLRVPWSLHHIEGETLPEVAAICGVSLATVKRRIAEASRWIERRTA
jgi:RNA polymerase sigma-70 factor (ECF subfamily)